MINDSFKLRYGKIAAAVAEQKNHRSTLLHNHNEFEILLICEGKSVIQIGSYYYSAEKGDLFFINPLEIHSVKTDKSLPYRHLCICFELSLINDKKL